MDPLLEKLLHGLRRKNIDALSAVCILQEAVRLVPRDEVEHTLRRLAAGKDGVSGTADDLVPPATVEQLVKLLDTGLIQDLVDALKIKKWCCL